MYIFKTIVGVAIISLLAGGGGWTQQSLVAAYQIHRQGYEQMRMGHYREAIPYFDQALKLKPDFLEAYANRALCHHAMHEDGAAKQDFDAGLKYYPGNPVLLTMKGAFEGEIGQTSQALADMTEALKAPADAYDKIQTDLHLQRDDTLIGRSMVYALDNQLPAAIADLTSALQFNPGAVRALLLRGSIYLHAGEIVKGLADADAAVKLQPRNGEALALRSEAYLLHNDVAKASADANLAVQVDPRSADAATASGDACFCRGELDKAEAAYRLAMKLDPRHYPTYLAKAWLDLAQGKTTIAAGDAEIVFQNEGFKVSSSPAACVMAALSCWIGNRPTDAEAIVAKGLERCDASLWSYEAIKYLHHDASAEEVLNAARNTSDRGMAHIWIGLNLLANSDTKGAVEQFTWVKDNAQGVLWFDAVAQGLLKQAAVVH